MAHGHGAAAPDKVHERPERLLYKANAVILFDLYFRDGVIILWMIDQLSLHNLLQSLTAARISCNHHVAKNAKQTTTEMK
jgi:hypothetical protein